MRLALHPDADIARVLLYSYGIGYHPLMRWLFLSRKALGNEMLCERYVICPTPSLAVELLRHPYEERFIGARYATPVEVAVNLGYIIPEKCHPIFFANVADTWLENVEIKNLSAKDQSGACNAHRIARTFAEDQDFIPARVMQYIRIAEHEHRERRRMQLN